MKPKDCCGLCGCNQPGVPHAMTGRTLEVIEFVRTVAEEEFLKTWVAEDKERFPFVEGRLQDLQKKKIKMVNEFWDIDHFGRKPEPPSWP